MKSPVSGLDKWAESEEYESGKGHKNQIAMTLFCLSDLSPRLDSWPFPGLPQRVAKIDLP